MACMLARLSVVADIYIDYKWLHARPLSIVWIITHTITHIIGYYTVQLRKHIVCTALQKYNNYSKP